jgi:dipeptidyl aminopeptidase/acylaminoacyl peptidase
MTARLGAFVVALALAVAVSAPAAAAPTPRPDPAAYRDQPPLAFVSDGQVHILDGRGSPPIRVSGVDDACCVAFSPDSYYVAFERHGDLWVAEHDGSELHRVARSVTRWEWAPDGQALAVVRDHASGIEFVGADDSRIRTTLLSGQRVLDMSWAGYGRRIAVSAVPERGPAGAAGRAQLLMLEVPGPYGNDCPALCPETPLPVAVSDADPGSRPLLAGWSPDVQAIALWTAPKDGGTLGVVSPGGGDVTPIAGTLVRRSWVQWSSNGDRLLVVEGTAREAGAPRALLLCTGPSACRPVAGGNEVVADPAWSRSGAMAYVGTDRRQLWVANPDGGEAHPLLAAGEGVAAPRWLPDGRHLAFVRDRAVWLVDAGGDGAAVPLAGPLGREGASPAVAPAHEPADHSPDLAERLYSVAP